MENHPIPQDVTGFQFKLIGNMTVKQFAYLAVGVVLAWVFLQLPISFLIKIPLCSFFAILGIGLAFFPISGRPMDLMIGNFIKALLRPTQFVYEKTGRDLYFSTKPTLTTPLPADKLKAYIQSQDLAHKNKVEERENNFLASVSNLSNLVTSAPTPTPQPMAQPVAQNTYIAPLPTSTSPQQAKVAVKINSMPARGRETGMPSAPDSPNLITGIVKDPRGNPLPNILIEVKDKENNPVRAFKTNEVGRFASATSLINGTYTIELEDPKGQNKFETKMINVTGQIIIPIEAISIDTREELRRSLFNAN